MYNVGFIPVRAGSKGVNDKNITLINGRPLLFWSLKAACDSKLDKVYVSTDSVKIKELLDLLPLKKLEVISRSEATASDTATSESALIEFCQNYEFDNVVFLQATSPMTQKKDINGALEKFLSSDKKSLISVIHNHQFLWDMNGNPTNYNPQNRPRRQDWDGYYIENGAFYISSRDEILKTGCRITPPVEYWEMGQESFFEVDTKEDIRIIEKLI